ncbi:TonB-dependent receptor domain-containing protein [Candidatus Foliamicus sp.]
MLAWLVLGLSCLPTALLAQDEIEPANPRLAEAIKSLTKSFAHDPQDVALVEHAANAGDRAAQVALCSAYRLGTGVPKNKAAAFDWCLAAGEQGASEAQYALGEICAVRPKSGGKAIAARWYRKAAEQGHADAQHALGEAYENGLYGQATDRERYLANALQWYRKAAEQGYAEAQLRMGSARQRGELGLVADENIAADWYRKAASQGLAKAQVRLGQQSAMGAGMPVDYSKAYASYLEALASVPESDAAQAFDARSEAYAALGQLAGLGFAPAAARVSADAERGVSAAHQELARMYANGRGVAQDFAESVRWYRLLGASHEALAIAGFRELAVLGYAPAVELLRSLANAGSATAQFALGAMYASGLGVAKDDSEAAEWFFLAVEHGNLEAVHRMAGAYSIGNTFAGSRLRILAERGHPHAQFHLAIRMLEKDERAAARWFRQAAEQDHPWAQAWLALVVSGIVGGQRDTKAAVAWSRAAAEKGVASAQTLLGWLYYMGEGTPKNLVEAYAWLRAALEHAQKSEVQLISFLMDIREADMDAMMAEFDERAVRILGQERYVLAKKRAKEIQRQHVFPYQCNLVAESGLVPANVSFSIPFYFEEGDAGSGDSGPATAGTDERAVELGRHVVTGSRIRRIDMQQARPVVTITREDIELSGRASLADVLRSNPVNSFGSTRELSGNYFIGQATVDLHGIGAGRTLVLLDGRRMPRSPVTANQVVDLNIIPLAAVERVEILADSASAIYGSDAIGGVVNIILRKDYEGVEFGASASRPTRPGADAESGVLTLGGATDRGRFLFAADFRNKEHIASADRSYTRGTTGYAAGPADYPDAPFPATWYAWENADNVSAWGNTIWPHYRAAPNCAQAVDAASGERLLAGPYIATGGEEYCGFHYALSAWETSELKRASAFLHADYELTPDHKLRLQSLFSTNNAHGRFAPAPGDIELTSAAAQGLQQSFGFDLPYPELLPYTLRHRFVGLGNRDFKALLTLQDHALLAYGTAGIFTYELEARNTRYVGSENSCCFPKAFTATQSVADGRYNPFDPLHTGNRAALTAMSANSTRDSRADLRSYSGNVSFDMFSLPAGRLSWAAGFDYFDENYRDIHDSQTSGGDLLGRFGVNGQGERRIKALFGETLIPLRNNLEVTAALRWDHYDDAAGSELSSYLAARYQPMRWLLLRASWGEGFRAGNLNNLYGGEVLRLETGFDLVGCRRDGIAPSDCIEAEVPTYTGGNPTLLPELSESYNLGAVLDLGALTARLDYWSVRLDNGISLQPLQSLIGWEFDGQCANTGRLENTRYTGVPAEIILCGNGSLLKRDPLSGALLEAAAPWDNTYRASYTGVDLEVAYRLRTARRGTFRFSVQAGTILSLETRSRAGAAWSSGLGTLSAAAAIAGARPSHRSSAAVVWNYGNHAVSGYIHHVSGFGVPEAEFALSAHTEVDLFYHWATPWGGRVSIGVSNLTDEDPELGSFSSPLPQAYDLYSLDGRIIHASYRHTF